MLVMERVRDIQRACRDIKALGDTIGFVPTMGAFHEGHLSLIRAAREECDKVVVSIFVNPTQFGPAEDFQSYPRDLENDKKAAENEGVDLIFAPTSREMYPLGFCTEVEVKGDITSRLCGASREGHFKGVTTVVNKLMNIVGPDIAYFGMKDAQQALVIKRMVKDLNMPVNVRTMPVVREEDGLAMSSRNINLSDREREQALNIYKALKTAERMAREGAGSAGPIRSAAMDILSQGKDVTVEYVEIADPDTLDPISEISGEALMLVAARVGETRLIDNIVLEREENRAR
jgi:pantoate--beta-alanine ligase